MVQERSCLTDIEILLQSSIRDDSDDDVLPVGPVRPLSTAASLGGARMDDDCWLQADSLNDELSVEAWAAESRHGTCCAQLDNFDWVVSRHDIAQAGVGRGVLRCRARCL